MGLLGLLMARMLNVHCIGIYHTDFHAEARHIIEDESASNIILSYERWFYSLMDEIRVPTNEYGKILEERNIHAKNVKLLRRGIEADDFEPMQDRKSYLKTELDIRDDLPYSTRDAYQRTNPWTSSARCTGVWQRPGTTST